MTTFADEILAASTLRGRDVGPGQAITEIMQDCDRFVIRREVEDIAIQIMDDTPRSQIPWPLPLLRSTWLEISDVIQGLPARTGLLLRESGIGVLLLSARGTGAGVSVVALTHDFDRQEVSIVLEPQHRTSGREIGLIVDRMLLILHMIQQPRIVERTLRVHDERLQRSRQKSGKRPLVHFHEVTVHVTRRERAAQAAAQDVERRTGRRLHHVRAFYRVRRGRLERVQAHWRGSAELGVSVATGHRVSR